MTNRQFDEVTSEARRLKFSLKRCPTCGSKPEEVAPGVYVWMELGLIRYNDEDKTCHCEWQIELMRRYLLAHIPKAYWTLGEAEYFGDPVAWRIATDYIDGWQDNKTQGLGLEFYSPTQGTGKTFLVSWIARQLIQLREDVYYRRFREIMGLFRKPNEESEAIADRLRNASVLVLDEVGVAVSDEQNHYFAMEFEDLMRARIDDNKVTLMTTNLTPDELDGEYFRTYSLLEAKQNRYEIQYKDARRSGDIFMISDAMIESGEVRPLQ